MRYISEGRSWWKAALFIALMACVVVTTTSPVSAAHPLRQVGNLYVVYMSADGGNALLMATSKHVVKATYDSAGDASAAGVAMRATPFGDWYFSGDGKIAGPGGANVEAYFNSHDNGGCGFWTCDDYVDGSSHARWWGANPYNADAMDLGDRIHESGCSVSVSFPPGVGFSGGGDTVTWDSGWNGPTWLLDHYYNNIHFSTGCGRWSMDQTSSTTARFGTSYYTTNANGSTSI